ncbi:hypothetical protein A3D80_03725 [Candidatus Roizmanbacteria bacterium RIFCSPHIGHO2_02_FULL_40_13b]|nr:MAG: hypothetical protein A3D80_03725 [Candidatus Roizmanbacteria bacterium RIFCSPHIGHO2_02_FULL_40_13b]OGK56178.1 MAG: hypothetical protein A3H83_00295 [Candidatus Roizmanbacteria bacterium RIFCSPLOWO2_02_FULL_39_8]
MKVLLHKRLLARRRGNEKFATTAIYTGIGAIVIFFLLSFLIFAFFAHDLPSPNKLKESGGNSTTFLDREGKVIYQMYKDKNRIPVNIANVPATLKNATVAIEDSGFYSHKGYSTKGFVRALFNTIVLRKTEGGSTLTQQLVKNVLLTSERTIPRKIKELVLSIEIERRYSKDEILQMYMNEAPYGGSFWGVEAAAKGYFGKTAKDLNLLESAFIAGLPQLPSVYSPFIGKDGAYVPRTQAVLRRMREDGYITKKEELAARVQLDKLKFTAPHVAFPAPHFVFYVRDQLAELFGQKILDQGLEIKTTLSLDVQENAEKIVKEEIEKIKSLNATNGSAVVLDSKTNEIMAMVGSYDYNDDKYGRYNTATALRQPGSAIKPVNYAAAFERGYTPSTILMDVKTTFPDQGGKEYIPVNYDGKFRGPVQLRFALGNSYNIPAVKLLAMVGVNQFLQKAYDFGLSQFEPTTANMNRFGLAITLGGGETRLLDLTSAYSVFAREGIARNYASILEVKDSHGKTIYKAKDRNDHRVISTGTAFLISHILSDNNARIDAFGPRSYLNIPGKTVAVKTGTTNDKRDNWTVGFTKGVTVGVWVGNNDNSPMNQKIASGVTGASPIWYRITSQLLAKYPDGIMSPPDDVTALIIDSYLGGLPRDGSPTRSEYFIKGTEPKAVSPFYKRVKISKDSGKLANDLEIKMGNYIEKDFIIFTENDPVSTDGKNRWQEAIDAWANGQSDEKFKPPRDTSDANSGAIVVSIKEPGDHTRFDSNSVRIRAKITSLDKVDKSEIVVNGQTKYTYTDDRRDIDETFDLPDGVYEIKVKAQNSKGSSTDSTLRIGVNKNWDEVTPTP